MVINHLLDGMILQVPGPVTLELLPFSNVLLELLPFSLCVAFGVGVLLGPPVHGMVPMVTG